MSATTLNTPSPFLRSLRQRLPRVLIYTLLALMAGLFLTPVYMVLLTSFKSIDQVSLPTMWELPTKITTEGFTQAFDRLAPNLVNSIQLVLPATILSAMFGSINGYILSKWRFRGANVLFPLMLFGMFIPYQAILVPLVQFLDRIGLSGNLLGLITVHVVYGLPITTLIFRNYYTEVPDDLIEAGKIDGAGFWGLYLRIILPISIPAFVVVIIWQFTQVWNEFLFGVTIAGQNAQPITVALQNLSGSQIVEWNIQMAGALLTGLPPLLVYILLGKYFIRGLLAGSVKG